MAIFEEAFPTSLWATHRYFPLSDLFTFVIVNSLLSAKKLILLPLLTRFPSFDQESTGSGFPVALQVNVTFLPSVVVSFCCWVAISGRSANFQKPTYTSFKPKREHVFKLFVEHRFKLFASEKLLRQILVDFKLSTSEILMTSWNLRKNVSFSPLCHNFIKLNSIYLNMFCRCE